MTSWFRRMWPPAPVSQVAYWTATDEPGWGRTLETLSSVQARWARYNESDVDMVVTHHDDMFVDSDHGREHYKWVGLSALGLITDAMILSGRTSFDSVLDLPCGGGRVTRHLLPFFPEAEIFVDDINAIKKSVVLDQFKATAFEAPKDFVGPPSRRFDLIFVGSLITHLDEPMLKDALAFLIGSLTTGGILIFTTHGRYSATSGRFWETHEGRTRQARSRLQRWRDRRNGRVVVDDALEAIESDFAETGFGYTEYRSYTEAFGQSYGGSFTSPSWIMRLLESRTDAMILGYKERAFANHQDVVTVQKLGG